MVELKKLPEQISGYNSFSLSEQFRNLIDRVPHYFGILLPDGKTVDASYFKGLGYEENISLDPFLRGAAYATLIGTGAQIKVPKNMVTEIDEKINEIYDEIKIMRGTYSGTVQELKEDIIRDDIEK